MGFKDGYEKAIIGFNKGVNGVADLTSTKKEFIFKQTINIILIFVILVVFGCFDFLKLRFHYEYFKNIDYWVQIFTKLIADVCSYNVGINLILDDIINKDITLARNKLTYEKLNTAKQNDFDEFIYRVYNPKMKREAYISRINFQIHALNRLSRRRDRILYSSTLPEKESEKLKNKYCIKRKELETLKSDKYIEKNLDSLIVPYRDIDPSVFELEIDGAEKSKQGKITGSIKAGRINGTLTTIMGVVMVSMLTTGIALEADKEQFETQAIAAAHYCMKAFSDIGIVLWQLFRGIISAPRIVSNQLTLPYAERNKVLMSYYSWREEKGLEVPNCYKELFIEKSDEEVLELTKEEYNKLKGE